MAHPSKELDTRYDDILLSASLGIPLKPGQADELLAALRQAEERAAQAEAALLEITATDTGEQARKIARLALSAGDNP